MTETSHRAGYVAVVGRPNVGKSTLINRLLGQHLTIVSPKAQTTRQRVTGILSLPNAQVILVDTPGYHRPSHLLGERMMQTIQTELGKVDAALLLIDGSARLADDDLALMTRMTQSGHPMIVAINKIDLTKKPDLLPLIDTVAKHAPDAEVIPLSARTGENVQTLIDILIARMPPGPPLFEEDQLSELPTRFFVAEFIREQVLHYTGQEVPHAVGVLIDEMHDEEAAPVVRIRATILVEREGQKAILIGQGGGKLKQIGTAARKALEHWLQRKVFLELWVKVRKDWREDPAMLKALGL